MKAVVTGAAGFVGANLVRRLVREGVDVVALHRPGGDAWRLVGLVDVERVALDVRDAPALRETLVRVRPDWVFHLAAHGAYSWQTDRDAILATNLTGTVAVVDAATEVDAEAVVVAGSSSEYGVRDHAPSEDELPEPNSDYAVAKAAATLYCGYAARERGANAVTLRLYSAYGPWEDPRRLVPTLLAHGLANRLPPLASPSIARDFVHVDDVCEAFLAAARRAAELRGRVYNIGSGVQTSLASIVGEVRRLLRIEMEPIWGSLPDRDWDTDVWVANVDRARRELGWQHRLDLPRGLEATLDWLRAYPEAVARLGVESRPVRP